MVYLTITCLLIGFDILTGVLKGLSAGNLSSEQMRNGLFRKAGELLTIFFGLIFDYTDDIFSLGINISIFYSMCAYISIMEILSIAENIAEINPQLKNLFSPYLDKLKGDNDDVKRH